MINHIEYKGELLPIRFSHYAMTKTQSYYETKHAEGISIDQIMQGDLKVLVPLTRFALEAGAKIEDKEPKVFTELELELLVDVCFFEIMKLVREFWDNLNKAMQTGETKELTNKQTNENSIEEKK